MTNDRPQAGMQDVRNDLESVGSTLDIYVRKAATRPHDEQLLASLRDTVWRAKAHLELVDEDQIAPEKWRELLARTEVLSTLVNSLRTGEQWEGPALASISVHEEGLRATVFALPTRPLPDALVHAHQTIDQLHANLALADAKFTELTRLLEEQRIAALETKKTQEESIRAATGMWTDAHHSWVQESESEVKRLLDEARYMLGEVSGTKWSELYFNLAEDEERRANSWRMTGMGFLVASVLVTGLTLLFHFVVEFLSLGESASLATRLAAFGFAASMFVPAAYTLRESGQHRRTGREARRVASELMLLKPIISDLVEEQRVPLMELIVPRYFRGGLENGETTGRKGIRDRLLDRVAGQSGQDNPDNQS